MILVSVLMNLVAASQLDDVSDALGDQASGALDHATGLLGSAVAAGVAGQVLGKVADGGANWYCSAPHDPGAPVPPPDPPPARSGRFARRSSRTVSWMRWHAEDGRRLVWESPCERRQRAGWRATLLLGGCAILAPLATAPMPVTLAGTVRDAGGPIIGAHVRLTAYEDDRCVALARSAAPPSQEDRQALRECTRPLGEVVSDEAGHTRSPTSALACTTRRSPGPCARARPCPAIRSSSRARTPS